MMMGRVGVDLWRMMAVAASLRVALVAYGEWQDAHMEVRYTDVDYVVFSDAAALMASGRSPFERSTYRYSPLLAAILLPNSLLHPTWGKFLFSFAGYVLQASLWYGLVVHFRIYPIIYSIPLVIVLNKAAFGPSKPLLNCTQEMEKSNSYARISDLLKMFSHPLQLLRNSLTRERVMFTLLSGSIFFICSTFFFYIYGWDFLHEALLYHLTRVDPRHNFSLYFYHIYLSHQSNITILEKLVSFLPQLMVQAVLILCFAQDLPFCFFVQTVAFVAFNKQSTISGLFLSLTFIMPSFMGFRRWYFYGATTRIYTS